MQPIERYGVVALLFLLVSVGAVLSWDSSVSAGSDSVAMATEAARSDAHVTLRAPIETLRFGEPAGSLPALNVDPDPVPPPTAPQPTALPASALPDHPAVDDFSLLERPTTDPGALTEAIPVLSESAPLREIIVQAGDSLGLIAQRELGGASKWTTIMPLNPGLDPLRLRVGMRIVIPGKSAVPTELPGVPVAALGMLPEAASGRQVIVRDGDTLGAIALRELGGASKWTEIVALNPSVDPLRLRPGMVLQLPDGTPSASATPVTSSGRVAEEDTRIAIGPGFLTGGSRGLGGVR